MKFFCLFCLIVFLAIVSTAFVQSESDESFNEDNQIAIDDEIISAHLKARADSQDQQAEPVEAEPREKVTITQWQFCLSCKKTVELYQKLTKETILSYQKLAKPARSQMEGTNVANRLCQDKEYDKFEPYVRYGCMKLMNDHRNEFLKEFAGFVGIPQLNNRAEGFSKKRHICVKHTKACDAYDFKKANVTSKERTKCKACRLIANDIANLDRMVGAVKHREHLKALLQEEYCSNLGFDYQPYGWLEHVCDEMVDDKINAISEVLDFHKKVRATGMNPSETVADMMCKEFFKCKAPTTSNNEL